VFNLKKPSLNGYLGGDHWLNMDWIKKMTQFKYQKHAYYSEELKCWVRMEREVDGEWTHTSSFRTREQALGIKVAHKPLFDRFGMPSFLTENT
jgi:hypothetical protein